VQNNSTWTRLQPLPTTWPPDSFRAPLSLAVAIGAVGVEVVSALVFFGSAMAAGAIDRHHPYDAPADVLLTSQVAAYLPLAAYLAVLLPPLSRVSLRQLGLRMPTSRELVIALIGIVAMYFVVGTVEALAEGLTHRHDTETAVALMRELNSPVERAIFILIAIVLAPMVEELFFRVFLFNAIWRYAPFWWAAVLSGALFGLVHVTSGGQLITIALPLACGGVVLAYVYAATRCYWANVLTHAGFNAIGVTAVMFFHQS